MKVRAFLRDKAGAVAMEYTLIAVIIGATLIAGAGTLGNWVGNQFNQVTEAVKDPNDKAFGG